MHEKNSLNALVQLFDAIEGGAIVVFNVARVQEALGVGASSDESTLSVIVRDMMVVSVLFELHHGGDE